MVVAVVIVSVLAIGLLVALVATQARVRALAAEQAGALERASRAEAGAAEAVEAHAGTVAELEAGRAQVEEEAAEARAAAVDADARAAEAERATAEAVEAARRAAESLGAARRAFGGATAEGLWVLEARRVERRWRQLEAAGADRSPFDGRADPARIAAEVVVGASREESGSAFGLRWTVDGPVPPARALAVVRVVEELVAGLGPLVDAGTVLVATGADGEGFELHARTDPRVGLPAELASALALLGAEVTEADDDDGQDVQHEGDLHEGDDADDGPDGETAAGGGEIVVRLA